MTGVAGDDVLNVRAEPGVEAPIIQRLAPGAEVTLRDDSKRVGQSRWQAVATPNGVGWVNSRFIRPAGTNPPKRQGTPAPGVEGVAANIRKALVAGDFAGLAAFVDRRGVMVANGPYIGEDGGKNDEVVVLAKRQIERAAGSKKVLLWGHTDGEGDPMRMTVAERLARLGRNYALVSTDAIAFEGCVGHGNSIDNLDERFPEAEVVEYHFDGTSEVGGMDCTASCS